MSITLYDAAALTFLQILGGAERVLEKGRDHCEANDIDLDDIIGMRLIEDMHPFRYQIVAMTHHSLGAIRAVEAGTFSPPPSDTDQDYGALQALVSETRDAIGAYSADAINGLADKRVEFRSGSFSLPYRGADFLLSFSLMNFYFHATTAYDLLRMKGVQIGKRDYAGRVRFLKE